VSLARRHVLRARYGHAGSTLRDAAFADLLDALGPVELTAAEHRSLYWLADYSETAHRIAGVIRRARAK
jgi:hypothetical protein